MTGAAPRVARVLPDEPALDKEFDYLVPGGLVGDVRPGTMVRAPLHGRRVGGWVVADQVTPPAGVELRPLAKVRGWGPDVELLELARWAAWRWAGRRASFLRTASPERAVRQLPPGRPPAAPARAPRDELAAQAFDLDRAVLRLAPAADRYDVVLAAVERGNALLLVPSVAAADVLARRLRRDGVAVARYPQDWARARAGATVVGTRAAAWAPVADLAAVVVLDEHDQVWQQEQAPTWHARDVAAERAARAGVPCVLVSPAPSLEARAWGQLLVPPRAAERAGWPLVEVADRRDDEPGRGGLFSAALVRLIRSGARVACVLNRKGRARLLACHRCGDLARCERCEGAMVQPEPGRLACVRCAQERPALCLACGATKLKVLRPGVSRVRDELEALVRTPVVEVTAETAALDLASAQVYVGTEAVLHQPLELDAVAFLDLDQELLAPRYRAAEEAMALVVRAARLVGPRARGGRLLLQTRLPDHEVVRAAVQADPARASDAELARRQLLRFPPVAALAAVSGAAGGAFIEALGHPEGVEVVGPTDGQWLLRAAEHAVLLDALAAVPRPGGRLRVAVDPLRL